MSYLSLVAQKILNPGGKADYVIPTKRTFTSTLERIVGCSRIQELYPPPKHGDYYVYPTDYDELIKRHNNAQIEYENVVFIKVLQNCRNKNTKPTNSWILDQIQQEIQCELLRQPNLYDEYDIGVVARRIRDGIQKELVSASKLSTLKK